MPLSCPVLRPHLSELRAAQRRRRRGEERGGRAPPRPRRPSITAPRPVARPPKLPRPRPAPRPSRARLSRVAQGQRGGGMCVLGVGSAARRWRVPRRTPSRYRSLRRPTRPAPRPVARPPALHSALHVLVLRVPSKGRRGGTARVCWVWVSPLEDDDGQDNNRHAPVLRLRGAQHVLCNVLRHVPRHVFRRVLHMPVL